MSKLFVTGDLHQGIDIHKLSTSAFPIQKELTKDDILVVLGDAGLVWSYGAEANGEEKYWREWLNNKPWTTFCVLGNHENYDEIEKLPIIEFGGAPVYQVSDSIFYAQTGNIYDLLGAKCLVVNGADSHDIYNSDGTLYRKPHISWWEQERITQSDIDKAMTNLDKYEEIDFLFSHTGGSEVCRWLGFKPTESDILFDQVLDKAFSKASTDGIYYKHYCGHYHRDKSFDRNKILYNQILLIKDTDD